jgi:hypothetical protein
MESSSRWLSRLYEPHCSGVHAVAQSGWTGTVIEDVAQMRIALATGNCRALHAKGHVLYFKDVLLGNGLPEAWPSRTGFELGL